MEYIIMTRTIITLIIIISTLYAGNALYASVSSMAEHHHSQLENI